MTLDISRYEIGVIVYFSNMDVLLGKINLPFMNDIARMRLGWQFGLFVSATKLRMSFNCATMAR